MSIRWTPQWRRQRLLVAVLAVSASCSGGDEPAIETVAPQDLTWVAPIESDVAEVNEPVDLTVYTANPGAQTIHFAVDGTEVGFCRPYPGDTAEPATAADIDPNPTEGAPPAGTPLENDPENPYPPAPDFSMVSEPADGSEPIASGVQGETDEYDDDEDTRPSIDVLDQDEDDGNGPLVDSANDCLANGTASWSAVFDTTGTHTLTAWFDAADGHRVTTSRTLTVRAQINDPASDPPATDSTTGAIVQADIAVEDRNNLGFHSPFSDGEQWAVQNHVIEVRNGRLRGDLRTIDNCMSQYGTSFARYSGLASEASMVATAYAYSHCNDDRAPGLSGLTGARCAALMRSADPTTALSPDACLERMHTTPDFSIAMSGANIERLERQHHWDPVLIAVALQSHSIRHSNKAPWHMAGSQSFIRRWIQGYNAYRAWKAQPGFNPRPVEQRRACPGGPGDMPGHDLGDLAGLRSKIQHIFILTQENHSFDMMFGHTSCAHCNQAPNDYSNRVDRGRVEPFHLPCTCPPNPHHSNASTIEEWDNGRMDHFAQDGGNHYRAMGFYRDSDHPFYTWLFHTFAISDTYFSARLGDTKLNRHYLMFAEDNSAATSVITRIVRADTPARVTLYGGEYTDGLGRGPTDPAQSIDQLIATLGGGGTPLPNGSVGFVRPSNSEHPAADSRLGEHDVWRIVNALIHGPYWSNSALILNYDEGGGFYDHVPPPEVCAPGGGYERLGVRVPVYVISPYAKTGRPSHAVHSHTSVTRFLEARFNAGALTARDANSDALLDMFDFSTTTPVNPSAVPEPPNPAHGDCDPTSCQHQSTRAARQAFHPFQH